MMSLSPARGRAHTDVISGGMNDDMDDPVVDRLWSRVYLMIGSTVNRV